MGYIHCCGGLRKTRTYKIAPKGKFIICELDYLYKCPVCGHATTQLTRIDENDNLSVIKKIKDKADIFFEKMKKYILYEKTGVNYSNYMYKKFYLNYNEYGVKKRCYSNISNLKLGLFDNQKNNYKLNSFPIKTI